MKSMIVLALVLTSTVSFSATTTVSTKACAALKGKELTACEAKNGKAAPVAAVTATATKEVNVASKDAKKDAPTLTAKNVKTTTTPVPAKK